jgi:hypothetical protein
MARGHQKVIFNKLYDLHYYLSLIIIQALSQQRNAAKKNDVSFIFIIVLDQQFEKFLAKRRKRSEESCSKSTDRKMFNLHGIKQPIFVPLIIWHHF